jgi:tetratricopeptide (TPR) repeat protein
MLFTAVLCAMHISGFPDDDFAVRERRVMESFRAGDYFALYDNIEALLLGHPFRAESFLYYFDIARMADVLGRDRAASTLGRLLERVESAGEVEGREIIRLNLLLELEKVLSPRDAKRSGEISRKLAPLRRWALMGPYGMYGPGDLYHAFLPELVSSLKSPDLKTRNIGINEPDGTLRCGKYLFPASGVAYAASSFRVRSAVKLRVYSGTHYALFINGKQVLVNGDADVTRRCRVVRVWGTDEVTVMLKLYRKRSWDARVIITDDAGRPLEVEPELDRFYLSEFRHSEELDHPFAAIMAMEEPAAKALSLAGYFDELESAESIAFYKRASGLRKDAETRYFLASALLGYSDDDASSARFLEGWRLMGETAKLDADFVPALHRVFRKIYDSRDYLKALTYGKDIYEKSKRYFPFRRDYARLMRLLGYRKEFEEEITRLRTDFPEAVFALREEAAYNRKYDQDKALSLYNDILKKGHDKKALSSLVSLLRRRGAHREALGAIEQHDVRGALAKDRMALLVDLGEYDRAKEFIYKKLVEREDPYYYLQLGYLDHRRGEDPLMHWKRYLELKPSYFTLSEYAGFLEKGIVVPPAAPHAGAAEEAVESWEKGTAGNGASSSVLFSGRAFELYRDGGSRVFCEDVISLADQKGIEKWGEYRIPYRGPFTPVRIRVYQPGGGYTDAYTIQSVDGVKYINLPSLKEKSLVRLSYYVENPVNEPALSRFFTIPLTTAGEFNEPLARFSFTVLAPPEMKVNLLALPGVPLEEKVSGGLKSRSFGFTGLPAVARESFSGNRLGILPFYSFSTMAGLKDLAAWYQGQLKGVFDADGEFCRRRFTGGGAKLVESVYDFVAREIDHRGRYLYYPSKASDVLYRKRGTVEEKVILAKSILARLGVLSYMALARALDFPDTGSYVSPDIFTDILLYVPLTRDNGLWLDFSGTEYGCGTVSGALDGTEAMLLMTDGYEMKRVTGTDGGAVKGRYRVEFTPEGNALIEASVEFSGTHGDFRKRFRNPADREKEAQSYFSGLIPSVDMEDFTLENLEERSKPFRVSIKGGCTGLAAPGRDGLMFRTSLVTSEAYQYIKYAARKQPLVIREPVHEEDSYEFVLPRGFGKLPAPADHSVTGRFGSADIRVRSDAARRSVTVSKKIHVRKGIIMPRDYAEFMDFCMKIKDVEYRNISAGL